MKNMRSGAGAASPEDQCPSAELGSEGAERELRNERVSMGGIGLSDGGMADAVRACFKHPTS
ncbi:hypothetical protein ABTL64_19515, partial [Acinetobacter baumannii]